jgi:hypothetical protein
MTPQIPEYLLVFESIVRPLVAAIALGLIWMGAARVDVSARSRYLTAGALSAALIAWQEVAQHLGAANIYFGTSETAVPTVLFGLLIPVMIGAIGLWLSGSIARLVSTVAIATRAGVLIRSTATPASRRCAKNMVLTSPRGGVRT